LYHRMWHQSASYHRIWLPSASSIQSNSSQVLPQIGIPINTSQLAGIVWCGPRRVCGRGRRQHGRISQRTTLHIAPRTSHLPQHIIYLMSICK
jgi:hypothetical protein